MRCVGAAAAVLLLVLLSQDAAAWWYDAAREELVDYCYGRHRLVNCGALGAGWVKMDGNRCFGLVKKPETFAAARAGCRGVGGDLVSIHSESDYNNVLCLLVRSSGSQLRVWVGGQRQQNGRYGWTDGSNFDFSRWDSGQPDFYGQNEKCVEMYLGRLGEWNDHVCTVKKAFVCAKKI